MCSHYQTLKDAELLLKLFGVPMPEKPYAHDMHPGVNGLFVRRLVKGDGNGSREQREAVVGHWGLTRRGAAPSPKLSTFCLLYTSPSPRDQRGSRMPSSA